MADFVSLLDDGTASSGQSATRRMRCVRLSQAEREDSFDASGFPQGAAVWEDIELPSFTEASLYAIEVDRDLGVPMLRAGDIVVVSPESSVRRNDRIVVRLRGGEIEFGVFNRRTAQRFSIGSFAAQGEDRTIPTSEVAWQARIICISAQP
jgi:phage repressor protein C with HTH and peptisase S24 domain